MDNLPDWAKKAFDKVGDWYYAFSSKFEGINNKIFEKFNIKLDVGLYVAIIVLIVFVIFFVRIILGSIFGFLFHGTYN